MENVIAYEKMFQGEIDKVEDSIKKVRDEIKKLCSEVKKLNSEKKLKEHSRDLFFGFKKEKKHYKKRIKQESKETQNI